MVIRKQGVDRLSVNALLVPDTQVGPVSRFFTLLSFSAGVVILASFSFDCSPRSLSLLLSFRDA